jgi:glycerol-3-phosphate acyltransferase PlsY
MFVWTDEQGQMGTNPWPLALAAALMAVLLIYRHRENIARLLAGEEGKIFGKKTTSQ